jgi:hypothetical protein
LVRGSPDRQPAKTNDFKFAFVESTNLIGFFKSLHNNVEHPTLLSIDKARPSVLESLVQLVGKQLTELLLLRLIDEKYARRNVVRRKSQIPYLAKTRNRSGEWLDDTA